MKHPAPVHRPFISRGIASVLLVLSISFVSPCMASESLFHRTVIAVNNASPEVKNRFASIVLAELADAYQTEAKLAREESAHNSNKLQRWSGSVNRYARDLQFLQESAALGMPVSLTVSSHRQTIINIADRQVIVTHPRPALQSALENQILQQFCDEGFCETYDPLPEVQATRKFLAASPSRPPEARRSTSSALRWKFNRDGGSCTQQGITIETSSTKGLGRFRELCNGFFRELSILQNELQWQSDHGVEIEWQQLQFTTLPNGQHQLTLDRAGDSIIGRFPLMAAHPGLIKYLRPWLIRQLDRDNKTLTINAAELGL